MKDSLNILIIFLFWNCSFAQTVEEVVNIEPRKESELVIDNYIDPLFFSLNSSDYLNIQLIKKTTDVLVQHHVKQIRLTGHCSVAELKTHPTVSLERANEIKNLMKGFGYDPNSIEIKDLKNTQPVEWTGNNEENQRVEIIILKA